MRRTLIRARQYLGHFFAVVASLAMVAALWACGVLVWGSLNRDDLFYVVTVWLFFMLVTVISASIAAVTWMDDLDRKEFALRHGERRSDGRNLP